MATKNEVNIIADPCDFILSKLSLKQDGGVDDPLLFFDIAQLVKRYNLWMEHMPRVKPFYAVKCNDNPILLQSLFRLGTGFDCASKSEIKTILDLGVSPSDIVYANPCKPQSHIRFALKKNVPLMTFDNEAELYKIASLFPSANLVIRIRADAPDAQVKLGVKFGCTVDDSQWLLEVAHNLGLNVVGVSFHVGSGCQSPTAYKTAITMAHQVFQHGKNKGFSFTILDIGGGFTGNESDNHVFIKVAKSVNSTIEQLFTDDYPNLTVIAEPGRFFAASVLTLATQVISKRAEPHQDPMYYINDGVYGTFSGIIYENALVQPHPLKGKSKKLFSCSIWGPTCDSIDKIGTFQLPEMNIGDWILFPNMGAYSIASSSGFNGFGRPEIIYFTEGHKSSKAMDCPFSCFNYSVDKVATNSIPCCS